MAKTQNDLIKEEQKILDDLIRDMDKVLLELNKKWTYKDVQASKAKSSCLPDTYGMLVAAEHDKIETRIAIRELRQGRDELYQTRIEVEYSDSDGHGKEDLKIGLHTYYKGSRIFIMSWKMPLCRHYLLDNSAEEYESVVAGKYGELYTTNYKLKLKRQIDMDFDKVKSVVHMFPVLDEETESIIADEFLQELLKRRSGQEFKNIVFSIQKKQGAIIQTPFKQNLIVQGCAGSGKSMIMLHRLPIVLYDNPNSLDRNNLYIITPSIAYIQMANNMRMDLEIEDLKMGTLEQYYDHVLEKYGKSSEDYGKIKPYLKISNDMLKYIYSKKCIEDIKSTFHYFIGKGQVDCSYGYELFGLKQKNRQATTYSERIQKELLIIQAPLKKNDEILKNYHHAIYESLQSLDELARLLEGRKTAVLRSIDRKIEDNKKKIKNAERDLLTIEKEAHEQKYKNRIGTIKNSELDISTLTEIKKDVEVSNEHFEALVEVAGRIRRLLHLFSDVKKERREMSIEQEYNAISNKEMIGITYSAVVRLLNNIGDPYNEYGDSYHDFLIKIASSIDAVRNNKELYLPEAFAKELMKARQYFTSLSGKLVQDTYLKFMKQLGQEPNPNGKLTALSCSPYLYLQILYIYAGVPNGPSESLITIDEAQNLEIEELRLIKAVNNNKVILNLFGDVKQHVEGSKGIDSWKDISEIASFKTEYMQENYRNARQITEFCNNRFQMDMHAINLDGSGVHEFNNEEEFIEGFSRIFQKPQNVGLSCILVKNREEAKSILSIAGAYKNRIHDLTEEYVEYDRKKWNLMTAEQAKGLEFETVFALSGRMSENEKYIAYTRALDELYIYDQEMHIDQPQLFEEDTKKKNEKTDANIRKKREKRKNNGE